MSLAEAGAANTGEVLRVATQIEPNDFESVYKAFYYMAEHIHSIAESIDPKKDPFGARSAYFRASTYYRGADFFDKHNQSDPRIASLWKQQLDSFNKAIALLKPAGERFTVKAHSETIGDFESIGVFYKASDCDDRTPTLLVGGGYDSSQEESYHAICKEVLSRGINCVTYEGPGQPTVRRDQNIGFIPDWWSAVTPIVDYLAERPDVDMKRLALAGLSFGGTLAPVAASHEHRFSAVAAIDGLNSITDVILEQLPTSLQTLYNTSNVEEFDEVMTAISANASSPSSIRWLIDQGLWNFNTKSPFDWFSRMSEIRMNKSLVATIPMPVFVGKGEDDTMTRQQPQIAYHLLTTERPNGKELTYFHEFNTSLGAGEHCSVGAEAQLWQVTMDWLSGIWGNWSYTTNAN